MITQEQMIAFSRKYQIDGITIMREYLQLLFLSYLYQTKEGNIIYFKGGTAIRLLFGSPRFSEDLDFSTALDKKQIKDAIKLLEKTIKEELPEFRILLLHSGKETTRFRIKYQLPRDKYPYVIRLDFHHVLKVGKTTVSPLVTQFPITLFPIISHLTIEEILKEKIQALATRGKGRDLFDVWYLLEKGIIPNQKINKKTLLKIVKQYPTIALKRDLAQFLPSPQRKIISLLKMRLQTMLQK